MPPAETSTSKATTQTHYIPAFLPFTSQSQGAHASPSNNGAQVTPPTAPPDQSCSDRCRGSGSLDRGEIIISECARTSGRCQCAEQSENNKPTPPETNATRQNPDVTNEENNWMGGKAESTSQQDRGGATEVCKGEFAQTRAPSLWPG